MLQNIRQHQNGILSWHSSKKHLLSNTPHVISLQTSVCQFSKFKIKSLLFPTENQCLPHKGHWIQLNSNITLSASSHRRKQSRGANTPQIREESITWFCYQKHGFFRSMEKVPTGKLKNALKLEPEQLLTWWKNVVRM